MNVEQRTIFHGRHRQAEAGRSCWLPTFALVVLLTGAPPAVAGHFIADNALDFPALIAPPPAPDSLVTRAELDVVLQLQDLRTPALARRAQEIESETLFGFAGEVV